MGVMKAILSLGAFVCFALLYVVALLTTRWGGGTDLAGEPEVDD